MRVFGGERIKTMMQTLKVPEDVPIESKLITNAIESAQKKLEGFNFDARKHVLEYDEVLNKHRETIYKRRDKALEAKDEEIFAMAQDSIQNYFGNFLSFHLGGDYKEDWNVEEIFEELRAILPVGGDVHKQLQEITKENADPKIIKQHFEKFVLDITRNALEEKNKEIGKDNFIKAIRWLILRTTDILWMEHLDAMHFMRDTVRLRAYAQRDPLIEYKNEGISMFRQLKDAIGAEFVKNLFKLQIHQHEPRTREPGFARTTVQGRQQQINTPTATNRDNKNQNPTGLTSGKGKKVGRNDPCPCGAKNKDGHPIKYKRCHGI